MTEQEAIQVASAFIEHQWGEPAVLIGAKPPSKKHREWTVLYKTTLPGGDPDEVVDGPTVVLVDPQTARAWFLLSL